MAVKAKDIPITREDVYVWIDEWKAKKDNSKLGDFIKTKVEGKKLDDPFVDTSGHGNLPDQVHVVDLIMMDIGSYSNAPDS